MRRLYIENLFVRLHRNTRGQDMVEYALLAGFIAVAAGAVFPPLSNSLSTIFSKMISVTSAASTT